MLETLAIVLIVLWALGFSFHLVGSAVHVLLVFALLLFIAKRL